MGTAVERLQALERLFMFELWQRLRELEAAVEARERGELPVGESEHLHAVASSIAASAGTLGLGSVQRAGEAVAGLLAKPPGDDDGAARVRAPLREALANLRLAAGQSDRLEGLEAGLGAADRPARPRRLLLVFAEDAELSAELSFQLGCYGFLVRSLDEPEELNAALPHAAGVILDVDVQADKGKAPRAIAAVVRHRQLTSEPPPLLILSGRHDLESRLRAVRFGADAFLPRSLDVRDLVERLEALVRHTVESPYRVLLVEDDYSAALPIMLTLQEAGMEVEVAQGAMEGLHRISDFDPDVLLANLELHGCSGPELVAVIRQERPHAELPVIFLSQRATLRQQLEAIRRGGDDLLSLPPTPEQLLLTVLGEARRHRLLRHFRTRDGLTGLLNFSSCLAALRQEVREATRAGRPLVLALLDVDRITELNQAQGHVAGDALLRGLADLLRQRFRKTDVLGRYANRFVVLLPGTTLADAMRVLEEVRVLFGEIHHRNRQRALAMTFSCGLARLHPGEGAMDLYQAARAALGRARDLGGDRLETGDE